jgi:hypothetical protein
MHHEIIERSYLDDKGEFDYFSCGIWELAIIHFVVLKYFHYFVMGVAMKIEHFNKIVKKGFKINMNRQSKI